MSQTSSFPVGEPFDPNIPLDYNTLGGVKAKSTPTEYNFFITWLRHVYFYSPIRPLIKFLTSIISKCSAFFTQTAVPTFYAKSQTILRHLRPTIMIQKLSQFKALSLYYSNTYLKPAVYSTATLPYTITTRYPYVSSFFFTILFSYLVMFDTETDLLHTPHFPIYDHSSALGKAIAAGRRVRRALGGRTFARYVNDKLSVGDQAPTKQHFVNHYGPFVDEIEWNEHYHYHDTVHYHIVMPPEEGISEEELKEQIAFIEMKRRYSLLDEQHRQRELFEQRRTELVDYLYEDVQWDLRDGSIIPPGESPDNTYKPYKFVPPNPKNPVPHDHPQLSHSVMGGDREDFYDQKELASQYNIGEFDESLLHMPNVTSLTEIRNMSHEADEAKIQMHYDAYVYGDKFEHK